MPATRAVAGIGVSGAGGGGKAPFAGRSNAGDEPRHTLSSGGGEKGLGARLMQSIYCQALLPGN